MTGPAGWSARTAAGTRRAWRRKTWSHSHRPWTKAATLARRMHGTSLARTKWRTRSRWSSRGARALKNWLAGNWSARRGSASHRANRLAGLNSRRARALRRWCRPNRRLINRPRSCLRHNHSRSRRLRPLRNWNSGTRCLRLRSLRRSLCARRRWRRTWGCCWGWRPGDRRRSYRRCCHRRSRNRSSRSNWPRSDRRCNYSRRRCCCWRAWCRSWRLDGRCSGLCFLRRRRSSRSCRRSGRGG